jgi:predicted helicase
LHLNYEDAEPYALERVDLRRNGSAFDAGLQGTLMPTGISNTSSTSTFVPPKAKLLASKQECKIILDTQTTLLGVPSLAWDYKLGNRSALEWILDQYKEKPPKDPTISMLFNTYRFSDYKEYVIDLLKRVCTVSVQTMEIIHQMPDSVEHTG